MLRPLTRFLLLLFAVIGMAQAWADELKGDIFISEEFGRIEIHSPGGKWNIKGRERLQGSQTIANLSLKAAHEGALPNISIFGEPKRFLLTADRVMSDHRALVAKRREMQGECGPIEIRNYASRKVNTYVCRYNVRTTSILTRIFILEGPSAFYLMSATVREEHFERVESLIDEVVENLKY